MNKYSGSRIYSRGIIMHIYYQSVFLVNVQYQTVIGMPQLFLVYNCVNKLYINFNSDSQFVSVFQMQTVNIINVYQKEVDVQISKRRYTPGSYKGELARSHPTFFLRKQYFFALQSLLAPPNAPLDVEIGIYFPQLQIYIAV